MAKSQGPPLKEPEDGEERLAEKRIEGMKQLCLWFETVEPEAAGGQVQIHAQEMPRHPVQALDLAVVPGLDTVLQEAEAPGVRVTADVVRVGPLLSAR